MNYFDISNSDFSELFWKKLLSFSSSLHHEKLNLFKKLDDLNFLRKKSDYNTGSCNSTTCWMLYSLAYYFQTMKIIEVGSFIGRSIFSILYGSKKANIYNNNIINAYCCDVSNSIKLPKIQGVNISQFHKTASVDMFKRLKNDKFDLFHFDGRLNLEELKYIKNLSHNQTIYIFDDFENLDKGVMNFALFTENNFLDNKYQFIPPPNINILNKFSLTEKTSTACLLPKDLIRLSHQ